MESWRNGWNAIDHSGETKKEIDYNGIAMTETTESRTSTDNGGWNKGKKDGFNQRKNGKRARNWKRNRLERRRSGGVVAQEGPTAAEAAGGIAHIHSVLQFVESALEDTEAEEQPDQDDHQYQARAQHAHSAPAAHLLLLLLLLLLFLLLLLLQIDPINVGEDGLL